MFVKLRFHIAKLLIFGRISKEYFQAVYAEDAAVSYLAALARSKDFDVAPTTVEWVTEWNDVTEFEDRAFGVLSPLRYESGKSIAMWKYQWGRRSWAMCERWIYVSSEPLWEYRIIWVVEYAGRGFELCFQAIIHKSPSEFYGVHLLVGVWQFRGEVGYHNLCEGIKVDFIDWWEYALRDADLRWCEHLLDLRTFVRVERAHVDLVFLDYGSSTIDFLTLEVRIYFCESACAMIQSRPTRSD